jgi:hypothetical protein
MKASFKEDAGKPGPSTLAERHAAFVRQARLAGKTLGTTNMPSHGEQSLEPFLKSIRGKYDAALTEELRLLALGSGGIADIEGRASDEKGLRIGKRVDHLKSSLRREQMEISELDDDDARHQSDVPVWVGISLVAVVESLFTYKAFSLLDLGNNITLMVLLVALTAVFVALPKALKWWYGEYIAESRHRRALAALPVISIGSGFYVLGLLRSRFLAEQASFTLDDPSMGGIPGPAASPFLFIGINIFLLTISYFLCHQLATPQQKKNRAALDRKETAIAKLEAQIEKAEAELSELPELQRGHLIGASTASASRRECHAQLNSYFREAVGAFVEANLAYRSDGRPKCFDSAIADLESPLE